MYGVRELPFFWEPFKSPLFTLIAIWLIPGLVAGLLGYLVFRNRIKGVYFSILTQDSIINYRGYVNGNLKQRLVSLTTLWSKNISNHEMMRTFNCGVGFCIISPRENIKKIQKHFVKKYYPYEIGFISSNKKKINLSNNLKW